MKHLETFPIDRSARRRGRPWAWLQRLLPTSPVRRASASRPQRATSTGGGVGRPPARAYDHLVGLYTKASTLRDCALVETRVGEDALSYGDAVRAGQHFDYSRHYLRRARETEASIDLELARLRHQGDDWESLSRAALTRARERLYGSPDLGGRPQVP